MHILTRILEANRDDAGSRNDAPFQQSLNVVEKHHRCFVCGEAIPRTLRLTESAIFLVSLGIRDETGQEIWPCTGIE